MLKFACRFVFMQHEHWTSSLFIVQPALLHHLAIFVCIHFSTKICLHSAAIHSQCKQTTPTKIERKEMNRDKKANQSFACYKHNFVDKWSKNPMNPLIVCKMVKCLFIEAYLLQVKNVFILMIGSTHLQIFEIIYSDVFFMCSGPSLAFTQWHASFKWVAKN